MLACHQRLTSAVALQQLLLQVLPALLLLHWMLLPKGDWQSCLSGAQQ
jgi:hypothetical protein